MLLGALSSVVIFIAPLAALSFSAIFSQQLFWQLSFGFVLFHLFTIVLRFFFSHNWVSDLIYLTFASPHSL
jgi:hypothetical protein